MSNYVQHKKKSKVTGCKLKRHAAQERRALRKAAKKARIRSRG